MRVAVLGGGSCGTAVSILLAEGGNEVRLWERTDETACMMAKHRENLTRLKGVSIPPEVLISSDLEEVATDCEIAVFAVTSHGEREVARRLSSLAFEGRIVVTFDKGIENRTLKRMSQILTEELGPSGLEQVVVVSGPSHAEELCRHIPTTVVAASNDPGSARVVQQVFMSSTFRVYTNEDVIGVELGGALKNVIALASGMCDGLGFGDNTKGALITRGLVEITRLGVAMGARPATFSGLSGMGDLITTCISRYSRNRYVGEQIGAGRSLDEILREMVMVAEGVRTTRSAFGLSRKFDVEMPICEQVYRVLFEGVSPRAAVSSLMTRGAKPEIWE